MRKLSLRGVLGLALAIVMAGSLAISCSIDLDSQYTQLQEIAEEIQSSDDGLISVTSLTTGGYILKFKDRGRVSIPAMPGQDNAIKSVIESDDDFVFVFADGSTIAIPRYYETYVLTFEDKDYKGPANTRTYWSAMIDEPQYGGPILYGDGCTWADQYNTWLSGSVLPYDATTWSGGLSGGGIAISNYGNGMLAGADYTRQLEVYNPALDGAGRKGCGNNGSDNFAIIYDAGYWGTNPAAITMTDGKPRVVESVYVNNTCYTMNFLVNGDAYNSPMAADGYFKVVATGYVGNEITGTLDFVLASNDEYVTYWAKWRLAELGAVDKITFMIYGSDDLYGDWGFNAPAYFAIDDIAVRK